MSGSDPRATARAEYDQAALRLPGLTVLNYGFHDAAEASVVDDREPERFCLRLYEHVAGGSTLAGATVLEVSCGRGGGAAFLAGMFSPAAYVGIDLSPGNIELARKRYALPNLSFAVGDAEALDIPDAAFDVVINIEASHLYQSRKAFFAEVFRVLKPGGRFCYADGCWRGDDLEPDLGAAGFTRLARRDITRNVVEALELDSPRREAIVDGVNDEERLAYEAWLIENHYDGPAHDAMVAGFGHAREFENRR